MKTTNQIAEHLRTMRVVADAIPLNCSQSVAVPGVAGGQPLLGFLFYLARGAAGQPKAIHPPVARVVIDKATGLIREMSFAPFIWRAGANETTVLGHFPGPGLRTRSLEEMGVLIQEYEEWTDRLLESIPPQGLQASERWSDWSRRFRVVHEEGLLPYFDFAGFPRADLEKQADTPTQSQPLKYEPTDDNAGVKPGEHPESIVAAIRLAEQAREFLRATNQPSQFHDAWVNARRLLDSGVFTVAVVGEFSRGKSTLINELLGEDLLPVGDLPTTATLTRIVGGKERSLVKISRGGERQTFELPIGEVAALPRQKGSDKDHVLQLSIENEWLSSTSICLFDTPGAGDLSDDRIAVLSEAIATCNATVIAVSAISPLSMTEQNFVEEHVFFHHVPHVALVITRLDQVASKDRESIVRFIAEKARTWVPEIEVWIATAQVDFDVEDESPVGTAAIQSRLTQWSQSPDRINDRAKQMSGQLLEIVAMARNGLEIQHALSLQEASERAESKRRLTQEIDLRKLRWDSLSLDLETQSLSASTAIEDAIKHQFGDLESRLTLELTRCPKPHDWWQQDLPLKLNREFRSLATKLNTTINQRFQFDLHAVEKKLQEAFGKTATNQPEGSVEIAINLPDAVSITPEDMSRYRTYGRVASGIAMAAGFALFGPIAGGASILGGLVTEKVFKGKTEDQKKELNQVLARALQQTSTDVVGSSRDWIRDAYASAAKQLSKRGDTWHQSQTSAINRDVPPINHLPQQIQEADDLTEQLRRYAGENA